jgi:hypothetical protein
VSSDDAVATVVPVVVTAVSGDRKRENYFVTCSGRFDTDCHDEIKERTESPLNHTEGICLLCAFQSDNKCKIANSFGNLESFTGLLLGLDSRFF